MAYYILEDCVECGVCVPECPEGAITEGSPYSIDPKLCTECGACAEVCPVDVCKPLPPISQEAKKPVARNPFKEGVLERERE